MGNEHRNLPEAQGQSIEVQVERVVFCNPETAWAVLRCLAPGKAPGLTAVGPLVGIKPGEHLRLRGEWIVDKKYGSQFRVTHYLSLKPSTLAGIERYLGSGLVEGIGPAMAKRLVAHFGRQTLNVIEEHAERLTEVEGIGPVRRDRIHDAWRSQEGIKEILIFLQAHGVSTAHAIRIHKCYGENAMSIVRENPFRLALDIIGIGFQTADAIASSLGIEKTSLKRAQSGVLHALAEAATEGHVYLPQRALQKRARAILAIEDHIVTKAIDLLLSEDKLVREDAQASDAIYLPALHAAEDECHRGLRRIADAHQGTAPGEIEHVISRLEVDMGIHLAAAQKEAIQFAVTGKIVVITGGPGTGKTTIVNGIIRILTQRGSRIVLAAPTGRAARRLSESSGQEAKTIHRLLEFDPRTSNFLRTKERPLPADVLVVDEVSMLDVPLLSHLLQAVPSFARLIFVGDVDQLPSVGPGNVLRDVIASQVAKVIELTQIFRQAEQSLIVKNAHAINRSRVEDLDLSNHTSSDFFFIERTSAEDILDTIKTLVNTRIPQRFGFDPFDDLQVLTPMHRGTLGAQNLNETLQGCLNPAGPTLTRGQHQFRLLDKVMQTRNNYDLGVSNGDIGRVRSIMEEERRLTVDFQGRLVTYEPSHLDQLVLAYACSVHKSQGSEYRAVIIPLSTQHYVMLRRNLLYTAVTRGKELVVLVGSKKALKIAIDTAHVKTRHSLLAERLAGAVP